MARSMIQRRQKAEREQIEAYCATLRRSQRAPRAAPDFSAAMDAVRRGFGGDAIRDPEAWRPRIKSRDTARLRLAAARHLYARYPVPSALDQIWLDENGLDEAEIRLRKRWYIIAARGGSLHREAASEWLTRKECHAFLNAPPCFGFNEAVWYAIARGLCEDVPVARQIARSKITLSPRGDMAFWREVARFFCANPASQSEIDDLCDFIADRRDRDRGYSLKGRTFTSLTRQMNEWHRDLATVRRIEAQRLRHAPNDATSPEGGRWPGSALADWSWRPAETGSRSTREAFWIVQLCSAEALVQETRAMHHCVWTYASKCILGRASIWSLRRVVAGKVERLLTIEIDQQNRAVQVRGYANRPAHADEERILVRWAKAKGIVLP